MSSFFWQLFYSNFQHGMLMFTATRLNDILVPSTHISDHKIQVSYKSWNQTNKLKQRE